MRTLCILLLILCVTGCVGRTPETDYYVLQSDVALTDADSAGKGLPCIQLRRVDIPGYLNRTPLVTRGQSGVRLTLPNFRAWAEPLEDGIQRVLVESLTQPLWAQGVLLQSLDESNAGASQLFVQIHRFDGVLGGQATLEARWTVRSANDQTLGRGVVVMHESAGADYESLVLAQSRLIRRMGETIAAPLATAAKKRVRL